MTQTYTDTNNGDKPCHARLVAVMDRSGSIEDGYSTNHQGFGDGITVYQPNGNESHWRVQVEGTARALISDYFLSVVDHHGPIWLEVTAFNVVPETLVDGRLITNAEEAYATASELMQHANGYTSSSTTMGLALQHAIDQVDAPEAVAACPNPTKGRIIDLSTDGAADDGPEVIRQRNIAEELGIIINTIGVENAEAATFLATHATTRATEKREAGFTMETEYSDYFGAIVRKLANELGYYDQKPESDFAGGIAPAPRQLAAEVVPSR